MLNPQRTVGNEIRVIPDADDDLESEVLTNSDVEFHHLENNEETVTDEDVDEDTHHILESHKQADNTSTLTTSNECIKFGDLEFDDLEFVILVTLVVIILLLILLIFLTLGILTNVLSTQTKISEWIDRNKVD